MDGADAAPAPAATAPLVAAAAGLAAFGLGLLLLGFGPGGARLRLTGPHRRALKRAAAANDPVAFRAAVAGAMQAEPELAALWRGRPAIVAGLAALDRAVYAPAGRETPDLAGLARLLGRSERPPRAASAGSDRLKPLDGPA